MPARPIELDIGCGSGHFLKAAAQFHPERIFIGIDINEHQCQRSMGLLRHKNITNAYIVHTEALQYIRGEVPRNSISAAHIYFPTPYVNEIMESNILGANVTGRLVTLPFLTELHNALRPGADLRIVTDHLGYFEDILALIRVTQFTPTVWVPPVPTTSRPYLVASTWERQQRIAGKRIYFTQLVA
jgi:tRNA (guanine-N7-)-methyltransferase